ncbi:MAG: cytochrome c [Thiotrichaceae bacterium]|nr:cytochrome c [Thiotrichaceae bacterium]
MRFFLSIILLFFTTTLLAKEESTVTLEKPPASLKQWYKPVNKRNVWHHNMFKLRRELQAVNEYMAEKDQVLTKKWAIELVTHYRKIADMVPEWKDELELEWADKLQIAATKGDFKTLNIALKKLKNSCKGCHNDYRAQVAAIYRAPDFSKIHVSLKGKKTDYLDFMKILMRDINRIKIATSDNNKVKAQNSLKAVRTGITILRSSCDNCHKNDNAKNYYLGTKTSKLLDKLETTIETGKSGRVLGALAVEACAHCHGSHRITYDLKREIE